MGVSAESAYIGNWTDVMMTMIMIMMIRIIMIVVIMKMCMLEVLNSQSSPPSVQCQKTMFLQQQKNYLRHFSGECRKNLSIHTTQCITHPEDVIDEKCSASLGAIK